MPDPDDPAGLIREAIRKIQALETPPEGELTSIAEHIKDL